MLGSWSEDHEPLRWALTLLRNFWLSCSPLIPRELIWRLLAAGGPLFLSFISRPPVYILYHRLFLLFHINTWFFFPIYYIFMPYSPRSRVRTPTSLGSRSIRPKKDEQEFGLAKKEYILF